MHIAIWNNQKFYEAGDTVPESLIVSTVPCGDVILSTGEYNPEGEEVLVSAEAYLIDRKRYDLGNDYTLKAVVRDNMLIPKLRRSKGQEQYVTTRLIKPSQRHQPVRVGDMLEHWPMLEKMWTDKEEAVEEIVEEALCAIEEASEITEDFALTNNVEEIDE